MECKTSPGKALRQALPMLLLQGALPVPLAAVIMKVTTPWRRQRRPRWRRQRRRERHGAWRPKQRPGRRRTGQMQKMEGQQPPREEAEEERVCRQLARKKPVAET